MKANNSLIAILLCCVSMSTLAKEGDLEQDVKISASSQMADIKNNQVIFKGPVEVTQGSIKINADELQAFSQEKSTDKILVATGKPATYSQIMDDGLRATASALEIRYDLAKRTLTLIGNASLSQDGSQVTGGRIRYDIEQQKLLAESAAKGQDRVITILQPSSYKKRKNNNSEAPAPAKQNNKQDTNKSDAKAAQQE